MSMSAADYLTGDTMDALDIKRSNLRYHEWALISFLVAEAMRGNDEAIDLLAFMGATSSGAVRERLAEVREMQVENEEG